MTEMLTSIKVTLSVVGGVVAWALGGCDTLLVLLIGFVVADYVSGVVLAIKNGKLNSRVGFVGILKKALIFIVVFLAQLLDSATGIGAIRSMAVLFYISNEGISLMENLGKLNVPYPQKLRDILEQLEKNE